MQSLFRSSRTQTLFKHVRYMGGGGHGHAAPQYTGIEASVRAYFPEGYHLAYMVLGGYATIIALSQIRGSFASAAKVAAIPAPEAPDYHTPIVVSNDIPSFGTPEWEAFIETDNSNFQVWLEHQFKE